MVKRTRGTEWGTLKHMLQKGNNVLVLNISLLTWFLYQKYHFYSGIYVISIAVIWIYKRPGVPQILGFICLFPCYTKYILLKCWVFKAYVAHTQVVHILLLSFQSKSYRKLIKGQVQQSLNSTLIPGDFFHQEFPRPLQRLKHKNWKKMAIINEITFK